MTVMKRHVFKLISAFLVLICAAAPAFSLSLEDAKALAVENSSTLKEKAFSYEKTMNELGVSIFVPSLSLNSTIGLVSVDKNTNLQDFVLKPSVSVNAGISWSLSSTDFYGKSKDHLSAENAALEYKSAVDGVKNSTEISYWNLVSLRYAVDKAEENLRTAESSLARTLELYEASRTSRLSYVQARLSYSDSQLSLESAKSNYALALAQFCQSLGIEEQEDMEFDGVPRIDRIEISSEKVALLKQMLMNSSSVTMAKNTERISQINAAVTEMNAMVPVVSLSTKLNYSPSIVNETVSENYTGSASVSISVPLDSYIPGSKQNANVKNAEIDRQRAKLSYESTVKKLEDSVDDALTSVTALLANRGNLVSHLEYAQANLNLVSEAYENGYASFADYEKAQSSLSSAQSQIDSNRFSIIARICSLAGILDTDAASIIEILER